MKSIAKDYIDRKWKKDKCEKCGKSMRVVYIRQHYYYRNILKRKMVRIGQLCLKCEIFKMEKIYW